MKISENIKRFLIILGAMATMSVCAFSQPTVAKQGLLDARTIDFSKRSLALNGQWYFFPNQLLTWQECLAKKSSTIAVPGVWNEVSSHQIGYGTYFLQVITNGTIKEFAIELPQLYNAYDLFIRDGLIAQNGVVGKNAETTSPQWFPQIATFELQHDTVNIILHLANFHHHVGGIRESLILGNADKIKRIHEVAVTSNFIELLILLIASSALFVFYFLQKRKKIILFFGLLTLTWGIRVMFSNLYLYNFFFPDLSWNIVVKIEYITLFSAIVWSTLFLNYLFKEVTSRPYAYLIITICIFFTIFVAFTSPLIFTRWLSLYLVTAASTLVYAIIVVVRAVLHEKAGVWFLAASLFTAVLTMGLDLIAYEGVISNNYFMISISYIIIFVLVTIALLKHLGILQTRVTTGNILTYDDLYKDQSKSKRD